MLDEWQRLDSGVMDVGFYVPIQLNTKVSEPNFRSLGFCEQIVGGGHWIPDPHAFTPASLSTSKVLQRQIVGSEHGILDLRKPISSRKSWWRWGGGRGQE